MGHVIFSLIGLKRILFSKALKAPPSLIGVERRRPGQGLGFRISFRGQSGPVMNKPFFSTEKQKESSKKAFTNVFFSRVVYMGHDDADV